MRRSICRPILHEVPTGHVCSCYGSKGESGGPFLPEGSSSSLIPSSLRTWAGAAAESHGPGEASLPCQGQAHILPQVQQIEVMRPLKCVIFVYLYLYLKHPTFTNEFRSNKSSLRVVGGYLEGSGKSYAASCLCRTF